MGMTPLAMTPLGATSLAPNIPFAPDVYPGSAMWLDAFTPSTMTLDGQSRVTTWTDRISGQVYLPANDGYLPAVYVPNELYYRNKPTLQFSESGNGYYAPCPLGPAGTPVDNVIIFCDFMRFSTGTLFNLFGSAGILAGKLPASGTNCFFDFGGTGAGQRLSWSMTVPIFSGNPESFNSDVCLAVFFGGSAYGGRGVRVNGTQVAFAAGTVPFNVPVGATAFAYNNEDFVNFCPQCITSGFGIAVDPTGDLLTLQKFEGHMAHKIGATGALPSDHPYKTALPYL